MSPSSPQQVPDPANPKIRKLIPDKTGKKASRDPEEYSQSPINVYKPKPTPTKPAIHIGSLNPSEPGQKPYDPQKYADKPPERESRLRKRAPRITKEEVMISGPKTVKPKSKPHPNRIVDKPRKKQKPSDYDMLEKPSPPDPHLGKFWDRKTGKWKEWAPGARKHSRTRWHAKGHYQKLSRRARRGVARNYYKVMFPHEVDNRADKEKSPKRVLLDEKRDKDWENLADFLQVHWNNYLSAKRSIRGISGDWTRGWDKTPPSSRFE